MAAVAGRKRPAAPPCRLEEYTAREEAHQKTLLCVNRLWEELNASISFIQYRWELARLLPPLLSGLLLHLI